MSRQITAEGLRLHGLWLRGHEDGVPLNLRGAHLRWAHLSSAQLRWADLRNAHLHDAILRGTSLRGADLRGASLNGADLRGADLRAADLSGADLRGADLREANLSGVVGYVAGPQRSDGYRFDLRWLAPAWRVVAGCQTGSNMTTDQYREHARGYDDPDKTAETLTILDYLDARAAVTPTNKGTKA